ncbi:GAF domain-containing sensor histidine kinase [Cellulosimicrobium marinum]|uniref:GAF domain-containing sensor histidine kinase n=1 Tax=Cellulosimicrobium marinum TaxID=1638992 RepID=UPI001E3B20FA|nr:GAF domain-containing sensor histidine kinase [Cellulosimicrobium marinum]MCB7135960.1 histidine kinase [Cellulosimicrobium marinum]
MGADGPGPGRAAAGAHGRDGASSRPWATAVAVVLSVGCAAVAAAFVTWRATTPDECALLTSSSRDWPPDALVPHVEGLCPVRVGDRVVELAGTTGDVMRYDVLRDGAPLVVEVAGRPLDVAARLLPAWSTLLFVAALLAVAVYVVVRTPRAPSAAALLLVGAGLASSTVVHVLELPLRGAFDPVARGLFLAAVVGCYLLAWGGVVALVLLFPWPVAPGRGAALAAAAAPGTAAVATLGAGLLGTWGTAAHVALLAQEYLVVVVLLGVVAVVVLRVRAGAPTPAAAQQLRWVGGTAVAAAALTCAVWFVPQLLVGSPLLPVAWVGLPGLLVVAGLVVALVRHGLFGHDVVLVRTVVASLLTLGIVTVYTGVVALLGSRASATVPTGVALAAAAAVALALDPMRSALTRTVRRTLFGDRDDPYRVLSRLGDRLADATRRDVLPLVAEEVARALRAPWVAVEVDGRETVVATRRPVADGTPAQDPAVEALAEPVPLVHHGERLGTLRVARRAPGEPYQPAERRLLVDLAGRVAAAVREEQLDADVRASRERLVLAREEERRALRRALHDDVTPAVAGLALRAATGRALVDREDRPLAEVGALLDTIRDDATRTAAEVRSLSYRLRPPALDERGLVVALREHAEALSVPVDVTSTVDARPLPAATEVAAYRIAVEALANVVEHARADRCALRLESRPGALRVVVEDDGVGIDGARWGVGLAAMRERAVELGGSLAVTGRGAARGTRVVADLPADDGGAP